jgi:hypothetical protein
MKFTFTSEQEGVIVQVSFEAVTLNDIDDIFRRFLRGSGFVLDNEEFL